MINITLNKNIEGSILDIGGGGEGIIGRIYKNQVTAIDNRQDELDETPNCFKKVLMDATCLTFKDKKFDNVTFFYTLMYMSKDDKQKAIKEAVRVLNEGGNLYIWDSNIDKHCKEPFIIDINIDANGENITTTYGVLKENINHHINEFLELLKELNLCLIEKKEYNNNFYLKFKK